MNTRVKKYKVNYCNRGFSLVELVIAFAILAFVATMIMAMMNAGVNMFNRTNRGVNLQYKSQAAMAQFQQYFMGANGGVCKDGNVYYIADKDSEKVYSLTFDPDKGELLLGEADKDDIISAEYNMEAGTQVFCTEVDSGFQISTVSRPKNDNIKVAVAVTVKLPLTYQGESYTATQNFTFRNNPVFISDSANGKKLETLVKEVWE